MCLPLANWLITVPVRLAHTQFVRRYQCVDKSIRLSTDKTTAAALIKHMKLEGRCMIGKSLVLYRGEEHGLLELHRALVCARVVCGGAGSVLAGLGSFRHLHSKV